MSAPVDHDNTVVPLPVRPHVRLVARAEDAVPPQDLDETISALKRIIFEHVRNLRPFDKSLAVSSAAAIVLTEVCGGPMAATAMFTDAVASIFEPGCDDDFDGPVVS